MSRILIVDDMAASREAMVKLLEREGYQTITAFNGAEGLAKLKSERPDLILLDHMMPEVDGLTFLASIRRFPRWKAIPVIMLTGNKDRSHVMRAKTLGVGDGDYLIKAEFTIPQLLDRVREHIAPKQELVPPAAPSGEVKTVAAAPQAAVPPRPARADGRPQLAARASSTIRGANGQTYGARF
jgi:CheY-like chemotaxis protein